MTSIANTRCSIFPLFQINEEGDVFNLLFVGIRYLEPFISACQSCERISWRLEKIMLSAPEMTKKVTSLSNLYYYLKNLESSPGESLGFE